MTPSIKQSVRSTLKAVDGSPNNFDKTNQATDERIADEILLKLTPSIKSNVRDLLGKGVDPSQTSSLDVYNYEQPAGGDLIKTIIKQLTPSIKQSVRSTLKAVDGSPNNFDKTNQATDERIADEILLKLTPSIKSNVGEILGKNNDVFTTSSLDNHNSQEQVEKDFINNIIEKLSPSIKDSVASTLRVTSDISDPNLRGIIQSDKSPAIGLGNSPLINQPIDESIVDTILSALTPSIISNVRKSLGGQNSDSKNRLLFSQATKSSQNGKPKFPNFPEVSDAKLTKIGGNDEELAEQILSELSPFIEGSIGRYFSNEDAGGKSSVEDEKFADNLITELLPTIQTLVTRKLGNNNKNTETGYTPFFNEK